MKRKFGIAVLSVVLVLVIAACGAASPFVGVWLGWQGDHSFGGHNKSSATYTFFRGGEGLRREMRGYRDDGTFREDAGFEIAFSWRAAGERLEISFEGSDIPLVYFYEFVDEKTLVMKREGRAEWGVRTMIRLDD